MYEADRRSALQIGLQPSIHSVLPQSPKANESSPWDRGTDVQQRCGCSKTKRTQSELNVFPVWDLRLYYSGTGVPRSGGVHRLRLVWR